MAFVFPTASLGDDASSSVGFLLLTPQKLLGSYRGVTKNLQGEEFPYFAANDGRVVCLTNFGSALLDLPFESADSDPREGGLGYRAFSEMIPQYGTKVRVLMEPAPKK
jgi:hypothetical protein